MVTFEKGKWYKSPKWDEFYIKCDRFEDNTVFTEEIISNKGRGTQHYYLKDKYTCNLNTYSLVDILEITKYLPINHPDLVTQEFILQLW